MHVKTFGSLNLNDAVVLRWTLSRALCFGIFVLWAEFGWCRVFEEEFQYHPKVTRRLTFKISVVAVSQDFLVICMVIFARICILLA
jgi:hypothetical protein